MNNPVSGARSKVNSIHDNISKDLDGYDISSYLDRSEAGEYIKKIPGVKDLLLTLKKIFGFLHDILDKIFAFIDMILALLEKIFDSIEEFLEALLKLLNSFLSAFGIHIGFRNSILESLLTNCVTIDRNDGFKPNLLLGLILGMIVGFATCEGDSNAYSRIYHHYIHTGEIGDVRGIIDNINIEIGFFPYPTPWITIGDDKDKLRDEIHDIVKDDPIIVNIISDIKTLELQLEAFMLEYNNFLNGIYTRDIMDIKRDIANNKSSAKQLRDDFDIFVANSDNTDVKNKLKEIDDLDKRLKILEATDTPRELQDLKDRLVIQEQKLEDLLYKANEEFKLIASLSIQTITTSTTINIANIIHGISDIVSTTPGRDAFNTLPNLSETLSLGIDNSIRVRYNPRDIIMKNNYIREYDLTTYLTFLDIDDSLFKNTSKDALLNNGHKVIISSLLNGDVIMNNKKHLSYEELNKAKTSIKNFLPVPPRITSKIGDTTFLINDPVFVYTPIDNCVYDLNVLFKPNDIDKVLTIFDLLGILENEGDMYLSRLIFIRTLLYYKAGTLTTIDLKDENGDFILDRSNINTDIKILALS